jgi:hypothetical protein
MALLDELVDQVASRTGLPKDKALAAAQAAVDFLDSRLPAPIGGQIKPLLGGEGGGGLGSVMGGLGGILGK